MTGYVYADSSFLVSIYRRDGNHEAACAFMKGRSSVLAFWPLHRIELRNALRMAEVQELITSGERRKTFQQIEDDLRDGFLVHVTIAWSDVCRRADELSEKHVVKYGQRVIDLLHVAAALECGTPMFLSFDERQRGLAKVAGLKVKP